MGRVSVRDSLRQRKAVDTATEGERVEEAYQSLFQPSAIPSQGASAEQTLPLDKLRTFFTAKIGFHAYTETELKLFSEGIRRNGLIERIKVRAISGTDEYEILSGHNRAAACRLLGWETIPAYVEVADDARAVVIATVTNLDRRQGLLPSERGWAYRALLEAQRCQGKRTDLEEHDTCGEKRHRLKTRDKVAEFFGVDTNKLRQEIRLTYLLQPLLDAVDAKRLKVTCGVALTDYGARSQQVFYDHWQDKGVKLTPKIWNEIKTRCPPPSFTREALAAAWQEAEACERTHTSGKPLSISVDRAVLAPVIEKLGGEEAIKELFLEFLKAQAGKE